MGLSGRLDDVLEAEGAFAGQPLAFAAAAQVLSVRPLGVHVALRHGAAAARFVARLEGRVWLDLAREACCRDRERAYVARDVLHAVRVEVLLAFPAELFEVDLQHSARARGLYGPTAVEVPFITPDGTKQLWK